MKIAQSLRNFTGNEIDPLYGTDTATLEGLNTIVYNLITVALYVGAILVFIMLLVGGFKYITSGGDPKAAEAAKKTITHAIMGIVLLVSGFLILRFIQVFTGAQVTNFNIIIP
jgi:NADH:ubiquinone oxidoreductase subunit 6 (subunit J)